MWEGLIVDDSNAIIWIVVLLFVLAVGIPIALVYWRRSRKLEAFAKANGLGYQKSNRELPTAYRGVVAATNVLETQSPGGSLVVFQGVFDTGKTTGDDGQPKMANIVVVRSQLPRRVPRLVCRPRHKLGDLGKSERFLTGDASFDNKFTCTTENVQFGTLVLTPQVRQLLLAAQPVFFIAEGQAVSLATKGALTEKNYQKVVAQAQAVWAAADPRAGLPAPGAG